MSGIGDFAECPLRDFIATCVTFGSDCSTLLPVIRNVAFSAIERPLMADSGLKLEHGSFP